MTEMPKNTSRAAGWLLLVYRVPSEPSHKRVAVWRDLKRIGALYLQQCVCIVPRRRALRTALTGVRGKIATLGGTSNLFEIPRVSAEDEAALITGFRDLITKQYAEIVEECATKFVKEIEFERFRENYSFAEAEEIAHDLEKLRVWFARVQAQDWFGAPGRDDVATWIQRCAQMLEEFYNEVHARAMAHASGPDAAELAHVLPTLHALSTDLHAADAPASLEACTPRPTGSKARRKTT
jgi:DNA-binding transcriptional regulator PaaX